MASLLQSHEQQYAVLTAEITSEIGKLKRMTAGIFIILENILNDSQLYLNHSFESQMETNGSEYGKSTIASMKAKNW